MADYSTLMQAQARDLQIRGNITFADGTQTAITGAEIAKLTIDEGADDALTPGCVLSAEFMMDLVNDEGQWLSGGAMLGFRSLPGAQLELELGVSDGDDVAWAQLGAFIIEGAQHMESEARVRLRGADGISYALSGTFEDALSYPATLQQLWQHAVLKSGYGHTGEIPNGDAVIDHAPEWKGASLRMALGHIAAAAGCFVRLDREGNLALCRVWDTAEPYAVHAGNYMRLECDATQFGPVDGLKVLPAGSEDAQARSYCTDDGQAALYAFSVSENPLFRADAEHLDALSRGLLAEIAGYRTLQAKFDFRGDPLLEIGRRISLTDLSGRVLEGVLSRQSFSLASGFSASCAMAVPTENADGVRRALTADGGVNAAALVGTVDGGLLKASSVTAEKIAAGVISAQAIQAVTAYISEVVAGNVTADQLYADIAAIAQAQITTANINDANIDWAGISTLAAQMADIADAQIGKAEIDYAKIVDLVTKTAIITQGEAGQLYIARLAVTEANMVSLSVGELMLKDANGNFVRLTVDADGGVATEIVEVEGGNIAENTIAGSNLIESTITARELNVEQIFADEALIRAIKAANIDVADLFAAQATVEQLNSWILSADTIQALEGALDVWASEKITLAVKTGEAAGVVNSSVTITEDEVDITTPKFEVNILSEDGTGNALTINEDGASFQSVQAPNVTPRYDGPATLYVNPDATSAQVAAGNYFRSLADALAQLDKKWVGKNVTINLAAGMVEYGTLSLAGVSGGCWINIVGNSSNHAKLVGRLNLYYCTSPLLVKYLDIDTTGIGLNVAGCMLVQYGLGVITGPGVSVSGTRCIYSSNGSTTVVYDSELYGCAYSMLSEFGGAITGSANKGNCLVGAARSMVFLQGTQPCTGTTWTKYEWAGEVKTSSNVTVNMGSATTPEAEPTVASYTAINTDSYGGSWSRFDDDDVRQGYTAAAGEIRGCIWFDNDAIRSALADRTILQASLSLYQLKGYGRGTSVSVCLKGTAMNYSGRTGNPGTVTDYGAIGTTTPGEATEITIPAQAAADLVAGTINGLMLIVDDGELYKDRNYSRNFARFAGQTTGSNLPVLRLTYV